MLIFLYFNINIYILGWFCGITKVAVIFMMVIAKKNVFVFAFVILMCIITG